MSVTSTLIQWYSLHKRDLPWRNTKNPYKIWLSEIILQQTRVDQGTSYYFKFTEAFPDVFSLARANEEQVLKLWQGLGYYSRARNLYYTAKLIVEKYNGVFPDNFEELKTLKGVGDYTAAAIASFSFNQATAVVDGNVFRFLARYYNIETPINGSSAKKEFTEIANQLIDPMQPGLFNQAIMEFGALQCKPSNPNCGQCPLSDSCGARKLGTIDKLPVKLKKGVVKERYIDYLVFFQKDSVFLRKRTGNDIWKNLHDFPSIEGLAFPTPEQLSNHLGGEPFKDDKSIIQHSSAVYKHQLTHRTIYARFHEVNLKKETPEWISQNTIRVSLDNIKEYGIPRLVERYLEEKNYFTDYQSK